MLPFILLLTTATGDVYVADHGMTSHDCATRMEEQVAVHGFSQGRPSCEPGLPADNVYTCEELATLGQGMHPDLREIAAQAMDIQRCPVS